MMENTLFDIFCRNTHQQLLGTIATIVYGTLESVAMLWRLRSYRDIIIIIIIIGIGKNNKNKT